MFVHPTASAVDDPRAPCEWRNLLCFLLPPSLYCGSFLCLRQLDALLGLCIGNYRGFANIYLGIISTQNALGRVLFSLAQHLPNVGYCQASTC
uniref:Secreted protein n=1 Tax=Heterorhabditis bacteriophora TaxID=37862 RepID=A0A1I7X144_HETBA